MTPDDTVFTDGVPDANGRLPDTAALFGNLQRQARYDFFSPTPAKRRSRR